MMSRYHTLCSYETWHHTRELLTSLAFAYLVLHASHP